jgi:hypothetical protein
VLLAFVAGTLGGCGAFRGVERGARQPVASPPNSSDTSSTHEEVVVVAPVTRRFVLVPNSTRLYIAADRASAFVHLVDREGAENLEEQRTLALERRWKEHQEATEKREAARAEKIKRKRKRSRRPRGKRKRARWRAAREKEQAVETERKERLRLEEGRHYADLFRARAASSPFEDPQRRFGVFRLVRFGTDWVEVETADDLDPQSHCYAAGLPSLQPLALRFFVAREDIQPVLRKRRTYPLWKFAQIGVVPGVAWVEGEARADGFRIAVNGVPRGDIGATYDAAQVYESPMTEMAISESAFAEGRVRIGRRRELTFNPYSGPYVVATARQGKRQFATVQSRCVELTVMVREKDLVVAPREDRSRIQMEDRLETGPSVPAGTEILWPNGERAGVARGRFFVGSEPVSHPDLACYRRNLWRRSETEAEGRARTLTLCLDKRNLTR